MTASVAATQRFAFADGSAGHACVFALGAPAENEWDVLFVNSDTTVTTPAGFDAQSAVTNQGAYIFRRQAVGGESDTVTITTSGNLNCHVIWARVVDAALADIPTPSSAQVNGSAGTTTPALTTGALAGTDELALAFAALHSFPAAVPNTPTWTGSGYTLVDNGSQGTGGGGVYGTVGRRSPVGAAAESPVCTWNNSASDRYILFIAFTPVSVVEPEGTLIETAPAATEAMAGDTPQAGQLAETGPAASESAAGDVPTVGALVETAPAATEALTGAADVTGALAETAPAATEAAVGASLAVMLGGLLAMPTTTVTIYAPSSDPDEWSGERTGDGAVASGVPASIIEQARTVNDPRTGTPRVVRNVTGRVPDGTPVVPTSRIVDGENRTYAVSSVRQARNPMWTGDIVLELFRTDQASP